MDPSTHPLIRSLLLFRRSLFWLGHALYEWLYVLLFCPNLLPAMWRWMEWSAFRSPYTAAERHQPDAGKYSNEELTYGEITLSTIDHILRHLGAGPKDQLFDLGSGRGRIVALAAARGIPSTGIEWLPGLLELATYATKDQTHAHFQQGDFLQADLSDATIIWVVGTCWSEGTLEALAQHLHTLPNRPTLISVSGPIPSIPIEEMLIDWTSWGRDRFYIQRMPEDH